MEYGLCRSVRTGSASGRVVGLHSGYVKPDVGCFEPRRVAGGGKKASLQHQEAIGGNRQGGMVMKAAPVSSFKMTEAKFLLQLFVVALDAPAQLDDGHQFAQTNRERQVRQPVFGWLLLRCRPLDQQPLCRGPSNCGILANCPVKGGIVLL